MQARHCSLGGVRYRFIVSVNHGVVVPCTEEGAVRGVGLTSAVGNGIF